MKQTALANSQGLALLRFIPYAILFSQSSINPDILYLYDDKVLILKFSWFSSNTNTQVWTKERSMGPYVAKMFFLQEMKVSGYTGVWYKNI